MPKPDADTVSCLVTPPTASQCTGVHPSPSKGTLNTGSTAFIIYQGTCVTYFSSNVAQFNVTYDGQTNSSSTTELSFTTVMGSFSYTIPGKAQSPGCSYSASPSSGTDLAGETQSVTFSSSCQTTVFNDNLPPSDYPGTWSVIYDGITASNSTADLISILAPIGSHTYTVSLSSPGISCTSAGGTAFSGPITGINWMCTTTFSESGVPSAEYSSWQTVYDGNATSTSPGTNIQFSSAPDSFAATFSLPGYSCSAAGANVITGASYTASSWSCTTTFSESGVPSVYYNSWQVVYNGTPTSTSPGSNIQFSTTPGIAPVTFSIPSYSCSATSIALTAGSSYTASIWTCTTTFSETGAATYIGNGSISEWGVTYDTSAKYSHSSTVGTWSTGIGDFNATPISQDTQGIISTSGAGENVAAGTGDGLPAVSWVYHPATGFRNSSIGHLYPITLTGLEASGASCSQAQQVFVNLSKSSSGYGSYAGSNMENVEFFYANGSVVGSWFPGYGYGTHFTTSYASTGGAGQGYWLRFGCVSSGNLTIYVGYGTPSNVDIMSTKDGQNACASSGAGISSVPDSGSYVFDNSGNVSLYYNFCSRSSGLPSIWSETSGTILNYTEAPYGLEILPSSSSSGWYGLYSYLSFPLSEGESLMVGARFYGDNNAGAFIGFDTASTPGSGNYAYGMSVGDGALTSDILYASYANSQYAADTGVSNVAGTFIYYLPYIDTGGAYNSNGPYLIEEDYSYANNADPIWNLSANTNAYADNYLLFDVSNNGGGTPGYPVSIGFYASVQSPYGVSPYTSSISSYGPGFSINP